MSVRDVRGREFGSKPRRIVSLVPSLTETIFAFGAGDQLVGISDYCIRPEAGVSTKPRIGGTKNPRIHDIVTLKPDLVLANIEENRKSDVEDLEALGVPVFCGFPHTVMQAIEEMRRLGELLESDEAEGPLRSIENEQVRQITRARVSRPRVFCPIWRDPWMTANEDTFVGDLIQTCGGENVFARRERRFPLAADVGSAPAREVPGADTRYPRLSIDEIVAAAPGVILLPDEPYHFGPADAEELHATRGLEHARIELLDGTLITWSGVRLGHAMQLVGELLDGGLHGN